MRLVSAINSGPIENSPLSAFRVRSRKYATTIHKSQGATVDRAFVMSSATVDRHLTYVAMTHHPDIVQLLAGRNDLKDIKALSASMNGRLER